MQLTAKLIELPPLQTGTSQNGEWKRQDIVVETQEPFPKKICMGVWGDKIEADKLKMGNLLKIDFNIQSHEYNGKWYTNLKAWRLEVVTSGIKEPLEDKNDFNQTEEEEDDLPF